MKLLSFLLALLVPVAASAVDLCPVVTKDGVASYNCPLVFSGDVDFEGTVIGVLPDGVLTESGTSPTGITYYVSSTGSDDNDCLAAGAGACATVQAAIDKIPHVVRRRYNINVQSGTYAGFQIQGRHFTNPAVASAEGSIKIYGGYSACSVSDIGGSGTTSGTIDSGDQFSFTDSSQTWAVNGLRGLFVTSGGFYGHIVENTATSLKVVGRNSAGFDNGETYQIYKHGTTIGGQPSGVTAIVTLNDISGSTERTDVYYVELSTLAFATGTFSGPVIEARYVSRVRLGNLTFGTGGTCGFGVYAKQVDMLVLGGSLYCKTCAPGGFIFEDVAYFDGTAGLAGVDIGTFGPEAAFTFKDCGRLVDLNLYIDDIGTGNCADFYGHQIVSPDHITCIAADGDGILATEGTVFVRGGYADGSTFVGTGNGGYGVSVSPMSSFVFNGTPTITGTSGDITLDNGATSLVWGTAFAGDGDVVVNSSALCRAQRKD